MIWLRWYWLPTCNVIGVRTRAVMATIAISDSAIEMDSIAESLVSSKNSLFVEGCHNLWTIIINGDTRIKSEGAYSGRPCVG